METLVMGVSTKNLFKFTFIPDWLLEIIIYNSKVINSSNDRH